MPQNFLSNLIVKTLASGGTAPTTTGTTKTVVTDQNGLLSFIPTPSGSVTYNVNNQRIDQTPAATGRTLLSGTVNGTNTTFTASNGSYAANSTTLVLNGQIQTPVTDYTETNPGTGVLDFIIAPPTGSIIILISTTQSNVSYTTTPTGVLYTATQRYQSNQNSTAEQTSLPSAGGIGSLTIPANAPTVGKAYRLRTWGTYQTPATPGQVTVKIKIGSVTVASVVVAASILAGNASVTEIFGEALITYRSIGTTGTVTCNGYLTFEIATGTTTIPFSTAATNGTNPLNDTIAVNSTIAGLVDVTQQWNSSAAQSTTISQVTLEALN